MVRLDRALDKAGLAATTAVEALVHLLGKGTQVALQLANGVLVALTIHAGEAGTPPATSLRTASHRRADYQGSGPPQREAHLLPQ